MASWGRFGGLMAAALLAGCNPAAEASQATAKPAEASASSVARETSTDAAPSSTAASTATSTSPSSAEGPPPEMATIPEGTFTMGGESPENTPRHEVAVGRFYLDLREITVDEYATCVKSGACKAMRVDNPFCNGLHEGRGKHPVNCIDWNDANAYCTSVGKRLPTEREWEYAARGGDQRLYSWGPEEPDTTRSCYMHTGGSCEVGSYAAGAFGLFDMTGNVWEWTSSWYGPYPAEATEGRFKIYRGGSWSRRFAKWMRGDLRNRYEVHEQSASVGFRCAKDHRPLACPSGSDEVNGGCVAKGTSAPAPSASAVASGHHPSAPGRSQSTSASVAVATTSASVKPEDTTPSRSRAPGFDADCQKHYPSTPVAYQWSGGTFQAREPLIAAAGCKKRDIGVGWSSACCAN